MIKKTTGYFESFDGTKIYYEVRGSGRPIVFCYGLVCTMNHWGQQLKHFSNEYQTIVLDYRAHHRSEIPRELDNLSVDALARDVLGLVNHLKLKNASFWGHSFGSQVLIRAYDIQPEVFSNMVLLNSFATNPMHGKFSLDLMTSFFDVLKSSYDQLPETSRYLWKFLSNNPLTLKATGWAGGFNIYLTALKDMEIYGRGVACVELDVFIRLFESMIHYDGLSVLDRINVPTFIVGGTKDGVTPQRFQKALHSRIKGSELLIVPYGSHCVQLDMPEMINLRAEQFLAANNYSPQK